MADKEVKITVACSGKKMFNHKAHEELHKAHKEDNRVL